MRKKVILVLLFVLGTMSAQKTEGQVLNLGKDPDNTISYVNVYKAIVEMGIKFPDIVFAQAILESGNFKSKLTKLNNNLFGMKLAKVRETTAIGKGKGGYAKYETWIHSIEDYSHWQNFMMKNKDLSRKQYLNLLGKIYATDRFYVSRLNRKIKEYQYITD